VGGGRGGVGGLCGRSERREGGLAREGWGAFIGLNRGGHQPAGRWVGRGGGVGRMASCSSDLSFPRDIQQPSFFVFSGESEALDRDPASFHQSARVGNPLALSRARRRRPAPCVDSTPAQRQVFGFLLGPSVPGAPSCEREQAEGGSAGSELRGAILPGSPARNGQSTSAKTARLLTGG
jgi:hypothetical protein